MEPGKASQLYMLILGIWYFYLGEGLLKRAFRYGCAVYVTNPALRPSATAVRTTLLSETQTEAYSSNPHVLSAQTWTSARGC